MPDNSQRPRCSSVSMLIGIALLMTSTAQLGATQQTQLPLQITSPSDGSIVAPGQTLTVSVVSTSGTEIPAVMVVSGNPIGMSDVADSTPAQVSITIPTNLARLGNYTLTAIGATSTGDVAESPIILIDVERPDAPVSLSADSQQLIFESQGQQLSLAISATFADGSSADVTQSSNVSYQSSDRSVATVDTMGVVTAVGTGGTVITVTYGPGNQLQLTVPITVEAPIFTPSSTQLIFGADQGVNVGTSVTGQLTLTNNTGNDSLSVTAVSITGDFSESDDCLSSSPLSGSGGTCTITVTFSPTAPGVRPGALTVENDFTVAPAIFPLTGFANSNFNVVATPSSQAATPGGSASFTVSVSTFDGFSGSVGLTATGLPSGASATFNPASFSATGSSTLTISVPASAATGSYPLNITGTDGAETQTWGFSQLNVVDFALTASPSQQTIQAGTSTSYTATASPLSGFADNVNLSVSGLPSGAIASFSPSTISGGSGSSTLSVNTSASVPAGTYTLTIAGTDAGSTLTHSTTLTLTVTPAVPVISSVQWNPLAVGGTQCVNGSAFGNTAGSLLVNGSAVSPVSNWTDTQVCAALQGIGTGTANLQIRNGAGSSNTVSFAVVAAPTISSVHPVSAGAGSQVTITGAGFGSTAGSIFITQGVGRPAFGIVNWTDTQVTGTVPTGVALGTYQMYITAQGLTLNVTSSFQVVAVPQISSVQWNPLAQGGTQCVNGSNFGSNLGTVLVNGVALSSGNISNWTGTQVCAALVGIGIGTVNLQISSGAGTSNTVSFAVVAAPTISSVHPLSAASGSQVTITGTGFGSTAGSIFITQGVGRPALGIVNWTDTQVTGTVPTGVALGTYRMYITAQGLTVNVTSSFQVVAGP